MSPVRMTQDAQNALYIGDHDCEREESVERRSVSCLMLRSVWEEPGIILHRISGQGKPMYSL